MKTFETVTSTCERRPSVDVRDKDKEVLDRVLSVETRGPGESVVEPERPRATQINGVVVGSVVAWLDGAWPVIDFPGNPSQRPLKARCLGSGGGIAKGDPVALMFEGGDVTKPLVIGPIEKLGAAEEARADGKSEPRSRTAQGVHGQADGEDVVLTADQLTLRCGKASITLTKSGKIILRGKYILSRSEGVNRIKGGSVQIN